MARKPPAQHRPNRKLLACAVVLPAALLAWGSWSLTQKDDALGTAALDQVKALVAFGPRPSGSAAHQRMEQYIIQQLQRAGAEAERDSFTAQTPIGPLPMDDIIARIGGGAGSDGRVLVLASHYDSKLFNDIRFVGANDSGSSTGLLLALAPIIAQRKFRHQVWLVFLDGEEDINAVNTSATALTEWSDDDALYGSRQLAAKWKADGTTKRVGALILLDMIGDADLDLARDTNSTAWLRDEVWSVAQRLGYARNFTSRSEAMDDDHIPFLRAGVPSVDLIDFDYGPGNSYWHTAQDTVDKLSARSLDVIGNVTLATLSDLDRQQ